MNPKKDMTEICVWVGIPGEFQSRDVEYTIDYLVHQVVGSKNS